MPTKIQDLPRIDDDVTYPRRDLPYSNHGPLQLVWVLRAMDEGRLVTIRSKSGGWSWLGPLQDLGYALHGVPEKPKGGALVRVE